MNKGNVDRLLKIAVGALLVALAFVIYKGLEQPLVGPGDGAPDFRFTTDQGTRMTPTSFNGKVLVLNFWATWCPPCVQEMPSLNELQKVLGREGLVVVGVSIDANEKVYRSFLQKFNITFQTYRDPKQDISFEYGTYRVPETYIIGANGKVLDKIISAPPKGWTDPDMLARVRSYLTKT
jgi:cytochrome c biogenesis protein CcmG, thiol:disulfide interchange protein DsbE